MKEDIRKNETTRKKAYRLKKSVSLSSAKKCQGIRLSRTTNRVKKVLPCSPRRKRRVVNLLFKQLNINKENCLHIKTSIERISQDTVNVIKHFTSKMTLVEWHQEKGMQLLFDLIQGKRKLKKAPLYEHQRNVYPF